MYSTFYVTVLFTLIYVLYLIDNAWLTGTRAWQHFREFKLWRRISPVRYYFDSSEGEVFGVENSTRKKFLFIVIPNATNAPLIWGFGLHNGRFASKIRLRYLLPAVMFYVPLLRDILMWSGAVAYHPGKQWQTINDLLNAGHSVAYSCNGMQDMFSAHKRDSNEICVKTPEDQIFEFAKAENVALVPVLVNGESQRYVFAPTPSFLVSIQKFCQRNWGLPWPLLYMPTRQSKLHMQFGPTIQPHLHETSDLLKQEFIHCIKSANNTGSDKKIIFE